MASSNDVQRLFLQAILSRRVVSAKLAKVLYAKCVEAVKAADENLAIQYTGSDAEWDNIITKVNNAIDGLDLEFKSQHDETTGRPMYALVNTKGDGIAQIATDYTANEITYFKAIVEQIMLGPRECYSVSSMAALREVNDIKNMTKSQGEVLLSSFVANGWLLKSKRGRYSLSTRTLQELQNYLKTTYPDEVVECTICLEPLTRGVACHTANCKTRMHFHCFTTFRRRKDKCPSCSAEWPEKAEDKPLIPVGEGAVKDGQDEGRRRVKRRASEGSGDEEEEEEEDMDQSQSQSHSQSQSAPSQSQAKRATRGKGKAKKAVVETDEEEEEDDDEDDDEPPRTQANGRRRSNRR